MTTISSPPAVDWRRPTVRPGRPRVLLVAALLAAAMPVRFPVPLSALPTVSVLDLVLGVAAVSLLLDAPFRRLALGPRTIVAALSLPVAAAVVSLVWSQDREVTLSVVIFSVESLIGYLFVIRELEGLPAERIIRYLEWLVIFLVLPAVFLLLGVPGFQVRQTGLSESSGDYLSYFTRLSHPVLGRSNNLATVLVVFLPVLLWWGHVHRRRSATVVGLIGVVAVAATQSRGVVLAAVLALMLFALVRPISRRRGRPVAGTLLIGGVAVVAAGVALFTLNPSTRTFATGRLSLTNVLLRQDLLQIALDYVRERPWLGWGPGVPPNGDVRLTVDVHNTYVQQLLSFGVPLGLLVAGSLLVLPVWFLVRAHRTPVAAAVAVALLIEMLSFAFESSYEGTVLRVVFYLSVGLLTGLVTSSPGDIDASDDAAATSGSA